MNKYIMDVFQKYLDKALHFLSFRPRSEKEVRDRLSLKKAPQEIIDRVITQLKEHKYLDDEDFARWFLENRLRFRPKSLRIIRLELVQKGVAREIVDKEISNFKFKISNNTNDLDLESARILVEKKIDKFKDLPKDKIYQKLGGYLARRGFDWDMIKKSIDDAMSSKV